MGEAIEEEERMHKMKKKKNDYVKQENTKDEETASSH